MSENVEINATEMEENETIVTEKKSFGSKLIDGVKKHKTEIAGIAVTAVCSYVAYKYGVKVGIKSVDVKPVIEAVADTDIGDVVEDVIQEAEI